MADAFGSINFTVLAGNMARSRYAEVNVSRIPGGTVDVIDYVGFSPRYLGYNVLLTEANYWALEALVGGTASLTTDVDGTISSAFLLGVARQQRIPESGTTFAGATFLVVTL